jgi:hypothetical protein
VHPGYLIDDPEGYHPELISDLRVAEGRLDSWLNEGAERFVVDAELRKALLALVDYEDSRKCLILMCNILETPGLVDRLSEVMNSESGKKVDAAQLLGRNSSISGRNKR